MKLAKFVSVLGIGLLILLGLEAPAQSVWPYKSAVKTIYGTDSLGRPMYKYNVDTLTSDTGRRQIIDIGWKNEGAYHFKADSFIPANRDTSLYDATG